MLCTIEEAEMNVPPGAHWLAGKLETCISNSDLRSCVANDIMRGANNVWMRHLELHLTGGGI